MHVSNVGIVDSMVWDSFARTDTDEERVSWAQEHKHVVPTT